MQDKKAISTVFATMLLIVLVLVAIVIIWALVRPALLRTTEETELKTLLLSTDISIERAWMEGGNLNVMVKSGSGTTQLSDIQITYLTDTQSASKMITEIGATVTVPGPNEARTYSFTPGFVPTIVKIAPEVVTSKGTEKLGDVKDEKAVEGVLSVAELCTRAEGALRIVAGSADIYPTGCDPNMGIGPCHLNFTLQILQDAGINDVRVEFEPSASETPFYIGSTTPGSESGYNWNQLLPVVGGSKAYDNTVAKPTTTPSLMTMNVRPRISSGLCGIADFQTGL